ncbi:MAG: hypothetical protein HY716_10730 [Planctomycetes bacterium]|nr:hypothetical protein [Planctomycetota bacterium]
MPHDFPFRNVVDNLEGVYRVRIEYAYEMRAWKETNGEAVPDPWTVAAPTGHQDKPVVHEIPGSGRLDPCPTCRAAG